MSVITPYKLSEQVVKLLQGYTPGEASSVSFNEIKLAIGQVISKLLKIDYLQANLKMGEFIPNGGVLAQYDNIQVRSTGNGKSEATLPIKPMKLPRGMGVYSVWIDGQYDNEFIPVQMGQLRLLKSQPLINDLLGQIGYEVNGMKWVFTKDLTELYPNKTISTNMVVMDISQYGDFDALPILPEQEWDVVKEVYSMYSNKPIPDKLVDPLVKESKGIPTIQQKQSP